MRTFEEFDAQFAEDEDGRNERLRKRRLAERNKLAETNYANFYDALIAAKARARLNNCGYAFAIQWPDGHCTIADDKPSLRNQQMKVIECDCTGGEYLA